MDHDLSMRIVMRIVINIECVNISKHIKNVVLRAVSRNDIFYITLLFPILQIWAPHQKTIQKSLLDIFQLKMLTSQDLCRIQSQHLRVESEVGVERLGEARRGEAKLEADGSIRLRGMWSCYERIVPPSLRYAAVHK